MRRRVAGTTDTVTRGGGGRSYGGKIPLVKRTMNINCSLAKVLTAVTALLLAGSLAGCGAAVNALEVIESAAGIGAPATVDPASATDAADALVRLESIPVKGRAPKTGHTRDEFGPAWATLTATAATPAMTSLPGT